MRAPAAYRQPGAGPARCVLRAAAVPQPHRCQRSLSGRQAAPAATTTTANEQLTFSNKPKTITIITLPKRRRRRRTGAARAEERGTNKDELGSNHHCSGNNNHHRRCRRRFRRSRPPPETSLPMKFHFVGDNDDVVERSGTRTERIGSLSVGPSATRNRGIKGTRESCHLVVNVCDANNNNKLLCMALATNNILSLPPIAAY